MPPGSYDAAAIILLSDGRRTTGVDTLEAAKMAADRGVRIYVEEDRVNDAAAVSLSSEIARKISDEMTFPGQIKVTVIREFKAVETAS